MKKKKGDENGRMQGNRGASAGYDILTRRARRGFDSRPEAASQFGRCDQISMLQKPEGVDHKGKSKQP